MPEYSEPRQVRPPLVGTTAMAISLILIAACALAVHIAMSRYRLTGAQLAEISLYALIGGFALPFTLGYFVLTRRSRRETAERHPPVVISQRADARALRSAWAQDSVVLGYNIHGEPWIWPDKVRVM